MEKEVNINCEVSQLGEVVVCGELCMDWDVTYLPRSELAFHGFAGAGGMPSALGQQGRAGSSSQEQQYSEKRKGHACSLSLNPLGVT